jgi:hypothetical protein
MDIIFYLNNIQIRVFCLKYICRDLTSKQQEQACMHELVGCLEQSKMEGKVSEYLLPVIVLLP